MSPTEAVDTSAQRGRSPSISRNIENFTLPKGLHEDVSQIIDPEHAKP